MKWSRPSPSETASLPVSSHSGSGQVTDHTSTQPPTEQQQQQQHCQHPVCWHASAGLPFNQATRQFLSHQHLTDLWLPHSRFSCHRPSPEDLVGIAAQACQELSVPSGSPARARFSTFTDRLRSSKVLPLGNSGWVSWHSSDVWYGEWMNTGPFLCRDLSCAQKHTLILADRCWCLPLATVFSLGMTTARHCPQQPQQMTTPIRPPATIVSIQQFSQLHRR